VCRARTGRSVTPTAWRDYNFNGRNGGISRNGHRGKTLLTEAGPVDFSVPRDLAQVGVDQNQLPGADDREPVGEL
jgi:hypothetical protein